MQQLKMEDEEFDELHEMMNLQEKKILKKLEEQEQNSPTTCTKACSNE